MVSDVGAFFPRPGSARAHLDRPLHETRDRRVAPRACVGQLLPSLRRRHTVAGVFSTGNETLVVGREAHLTKPSGTLPSACSGPFDAVCQAILTPPPRRGRRQAARRRTFELDESSLPDVVDQHDDHRQQDVNEATEGARNLAARPGTDVGVGDERREHHACDQEDRHAQQRHIDDATHLVEGDGALTTQRGDRPKKRDNRDSGPRMRTDRSA